MSAKAGENLVTAQGDRLGATERAPPRLCRDVLSVPGLRTVLLLEGTNDLGGGGNAPTRAREPGHQRHARDRRPGTRTALEAILG